MPCRFNQSHAAETSSCGLEVAWLEAYPHSSAIPTAAHVGPTLPSPEQYSLTPVQLSMQLDMGDPPVTVTIEQRGSRQAYHEHEAKPSGSPASMPACQASGDSLASSKKRKRVDSEATDTADMSAGSQADNAMPIATASSSEPGRSSAHPMPSLSAPQISNLSMAKSPSTASVHAHSNSCQAHAETVPAADNKSSDDGEVVWRSREQLAACLSCDLCNEVLNDPVTAPECMHSYCRDCIDKHVLFGGRKNWCPVCKKEGLETVLGTQPFQHGKLQFDPMLADMIRKLFPRAEVEKGIQERQDAEAKWRASLPVKKQKVAAAKPVQSAKLKPPAASAPAPAAALTVQQRQSASPVGTITEVPGGVARVIDPKVTLFLQTDEHHRLHLPYLRLEPGMSFQVLASFVCSQLQLDACLFRVELYCEDVMLQPTHCVGSVVQQWLVHHSSEEPITINVRTSMKQYVETCLFATLLDVISPTP